MNYDKFRAMSSDIVLAADGEDLAQIQRGFSIARQYIAISEQRFSRFTETSELAALNRSAGEWFQTSLEMFQLLHVARRLAFTTDGLFNPAVLPALLQAGYDRSIDEIRSSPATHAPVRVQELQDFRLIELDDTTQAVRLPEGMQVDLGGIAKGWIAEQAAFRLGEYAQACAVSAGGDMFMRDLPEGELDWEIGLENPLQPEQDLAVLRVAPGAVATSAITKRRWQHNGRMQHHLIDPRTGEPAITEWLSVTVWAEQATEAEVYAKALLIGGQPAAHELFSNHSSKSYLAVDGRGWVHGSENYHEVFHV